jgi:hypothetical protein
MLRQGWAVADVCYYYGDQAPNFYPSLCNVPEKPLLEGLDARNDYDVCSSQVILERMRVENNRIVLPDGMSYAVLVLSSQAHIPEEVSRKIQTLVDAGAKVINGNLSEELRKIGVGPDFEVAGLPAGDLGRFDFIHRKTLKEEFYFIRNKTNATQTLTCRFRVATTNGLTPEFWWPESGQRSVCHDWKGVAFGKTELPVTLAPMGSVFVVFKKGDVAQDAIPRDTFVAAQTPAPLALDGAWQVEFPEGWGAPKTTTFEKLQSWTESDNEGIRFFSGIATYRKTFELTESLAKTKRLFLQLGDLAEIAEVTLNGKRLGLVWLPPYRIEISGAAHAGPNKLEIRVANLWANRLNADSLRPESERLTRSNLDRIQTDPTSDSSYGRVPKGPTRPVYTTLPPLMKSGLFGPVQIITPRDLKIEGEKQ